MSQPQETSLRVPDLNEFQVGDWSARPSEGTLRLNHRTIRLEPRVMDVLVYLAAHPGQVVSKEQLMDAVWGSTFVEEGALSQAVHSLRKALGDDARNPSYLQTLPKRGYRLLAPVLSEVSGKETREVEPVAEAPPPSPLVDLESGRAPDRRTSRRKALPVTLLAGTLTVLVVVALPPWQPWQAMEPPLRIAILQPVVKSVESHPETDFVASDVVAATLAALVSLDGVQPLDPPERDEGKWMEAARLREADEAIIPLLDCRKVSCQVILHRRKPDGFILAVSDPFEVQSGFEHAYQLAEGVRVHVQQVYSGHPLRQGSPSGTVRPEDHSAYMAIKRRVESGEHLGERDLDQLDALVQTSPGLVGAYVLATGVARSQGNFDRALAYATQAENLAPYDPRPLIARLLAELEGNRLDAAPATLARLESLAPGDIRVKTARADLLEARGELGKARSLREEVAQLRPTWRHILKLATLESRLGESDSARQRLEEILTMQPDNQFVRERLAGLEMVYGDPQRAAILYEELTRTGRAASYLSRNLGIVRYLLGDFAAAAVAYRQALSADPDDLVTRFNLAATLQAQGDLAGARRRYRSLATELVARAARLDAPTRMLHAQCLVRIGQQAEAARIASEVLEQTPEDLQVLYQAAQIHALLGERVPALFYTDLALKRGVRRVWFTIPEFRSLEKDQDFQDLLNRSTGRDLRVTPSTSLSGFRSEKLQSLEVVPGPPH